MDENQDSLAQNEQHIIKNQEILIHCLTKDKENLESHWLQESKNYQNQIKKLSDNIIEMNNLLVTTEETYNKEILEKR